MKRELPGVRQVAIVVLFACVVDPVEAQRGNETTRSLATIEWIIRAPTTTPKDSVLCLLGSPVELGAWQPPGMALVRQEDGRFTRKIKLPRGPVVEYKVTGGSWETVEKGSKGEEIGNRRLAIDKDAIVEIEVASWATTPGSAASSRPAPASRRTGSIRTHEHFKSKALGNERTLWVWLPPNYESTTQQRYPVLYMHDGQNLFDGSLAFIGIEWGADETADRLIRGGKIPPIIIVGIANTPDRMNEYTPWADEARGTGGKGEAYGRFLVEEVKPFIDKSYRSKPDRANTAVAGSSLGGLISLHLAMTHPEIFSKCAAISPALMWADGRMLKEVEAKSEKLKGIRLWFDMGTREGRQIETFESAVMWTRGLEKTLMKAGLNQDSDYRYVEVKDGEHNEAAWEKRFDQVLVFLWSEPDPKR